MIVFEAPYKPAPGGTTTRAVSKTLDSTDLSPSSILLRESVQNSYDAKLNNKQPLEFYLNGYKLPKANIEKIQKLIGRDGINKSGQALMQRLYASSYNLEIADRNSTGLTGKSGFQDNTSNQEEKFHHFIYMTGNDDKKADSSGGSFGYGKASLYKYSNLRTIAVYSRVEINGVFETRFILCRIDERIKDNSSRCWWGLEDKYNQTTSYAAALLNEDADSLANLFCMKPFEKEETGTDILLLDVSHQKELQDIIPNSTFEDTFKELFPELILHWFWAKTNSPRLDKTINFHLSFEGKDFSERLIDPETCYPYSYFVKSLNLYYETEGVDESKGIFPVTKERPKQFIGRTVLKKSNTKECKLKYTDQNFSKPTIAFMRDVEFIVTYYSSNQNLKESKTAFGIFHTTQDLEQYFRTFENQTHDAWNFKKDNDYEYSYDFIGPIWGQVDQSVKKLYGINDEIEANSTVSAGIAEQLGAFLGFGFRGGASVTPKESSPTRGGGGTRSKKPNFKRTKTNPTLDIEDSKKIISIEFEAININKEYTVALIPYLKSNDTEKTVEMAADNELKIIDTVFNKKTLKVIKDSDNKSYQLSVKEDGIYKIRIECGVQCSFDIKSEITIGK